MKEKIIRKYQFDRFRHHLKKMQTNLAKQYQNI